MTVAGANDFLVLQTPAGETYNITKANFLAGVGTGTGTGTTGETSLTYVSDGDNNGLFYFLGTNRKTQAWQNPQSNGSVIISLSGGVNGDPLSSLTDREPSSFYGDSSPGCWVKIDLGTTKLKCNYYSLRNRKIPEYYLRSWKLQGSDNDLDWIDLDSQVSNSTLNSPSQWLSLPVTNNATAFSKFRLLQCGTTSSGYYFICLGEIELYGVYTP
jgi:hypothetical protein